MKKLKVSLIILMSFIAFIFFCRLDYTRIIFNDYILNICDVTHPENNVKRSFTVTSKYEIDWHNGLYKLEFCSVHRGRDNTVYIVRLKDAYTGKIYKTALAKEVVEFDDWYSTAVLTNTGEGGIYFCLPRKNDLNKALIEKRVGMAFEQFLKEQNRSNCIQVGFNELSFEDEAGKAFLPVNDSDYQAWALKHKQGGDMIIFSDTKTYLVLQEKLEYEL